MRRRPSPWVSAGVQVPAVVGPVHGLHRMGWAAPAMRRKQHLGTPGGRSSHACTWWCWSVHGAWNGFILTPEAPSLAGHCIHQGLHTPPCEGGWHGQEGAQGIRCKGSRRGALQRPLAALRSSCRWRRRRRAGRGMAGLSAARHKYGRPEGRARALPGNRVLQQPSSTKETRAPGPSMTPLHHSLDTPPPLVMYRTSSRSSLSM